MADTGNAATTVVGGTSGAPRRIYATVLLSDFGAPEKLAAVCQVDKDNFPAILQEARPTLALAIKDPLGGSGDWEFRLTFDSLRAFEPAGICKALPAAQWRLGVREKAVARRRGEVSASDFTQAVHAAAAGDASLKWLTVADAPGAPAAGGAAPAASGNVLDMVDAPSAAASVSAEVEKLARDAGSPDARVSGSEAGRLDSILARLDRELSSIVNAVLKHPDVARLETAWRGVKFLVDRMDFRENVRLYIANATRETIVDRLVEAAIDPVFDGAIPTPGMIVADMTFTNSPLDIETLDLLAQHAAGVPVPLAFSLDANFFGVKTWRLVKNLPNLVGLVDGWAFAKWRALRDKPYARALAPVVGRFILRSPYAKPADGPAIVETASTIDDLRFGGGHLTLALCAARAHARHGWPTRMFGAESGKIEDLPVVPNPNDSQTPWGPGDLVLPDRRVDELPPIGINALMSVPGKDHCLLLGGVSAARPIKTAQNTAQTAALEISLVYQQISNIVGAAVCEQASSWHGLPPDEIQQRAMAALYQLLGLKQDDPADTLTVGVGPHPDQPQRTVVYLRIAPPQRVAPEGLHLELSFAV